MSLKLLKQSVDIIEDDLSSTREKKKKGTQSIGFKSQKQHTLQNRINGDHHKGQQEKKKLKDVQYELMAKSNKANENIKRLLALSMNPVKAKDAEKMVQRAHKGRYIKKIIPKVKEESIFTEEDFRKFEEEYFNS